MPNTPLQQVLADIVTQLENTITYLAALEAALVHDGTVAEGAAKSYVLAEGRKLSDLRVAISRLQF